MEAVAREFEKNRYGICVVKCCASCLHHQATADDKIRTCKLGKGKHAPDYLCKSGWKMAPGLENAGKGGGRVKKKAYFEYLMKEGFHHMYDYEKQYGSKYLTKK